MKIIIDEKIKIEGRIKGIPMYGSSLNQVIGGHTALMELAWEDPYNAPSQQLTNAYNKSQNTTPLQ
ncbi:hypothetical protein [Anaerophilus nitritogenes]|uniref:hypothetical protein n=1 Tax=Anaerophilus nitritogenes TaxID=2498136 RepID=UPI00193115DF|nr:hypothetical protein [Anaerophilus nitritogenes]